MNLEETFSRLRDRIAADLPVPGDDPVTHFFGPPTFSALTEVAVCLLSVVAKSEHALPGPEEFRKHFLAILAADQPGNFAMQTWGVSALDAARIDALLATRPAMPECFNTLVYSRHELQDMPPQEMLGLLYRIYLGRAPDPQGLQTWTAEIRSGTAIGDIVAEFRDSEEARIASTGRDLMVLEHETGALQGLLLNYRRLQYLELSRLYDFARLVLLIKG